MKTDLRDPAQRVTEIAARIRRRAIDKGRREHQGAVRLAQYWQQADATARSRRADAREQRAAAVLASLPRAARQRIQEDRADVAEQRPILPTCDTLIVRCVPASVRSYQDRVSTSVLALCQWWDKHRHWQRRIKIERAEFRAKHYKVLNEDRMMNDADF